MRLNALSKFPLNEGGLPPEERAKLHQYVTLNFLSEPEKQIVAKVRQYLFKGDSYLKQLLASGGVNMGKVIFAIKSERCISGPDKDVGSTYLESVIGNAIRDLFDGEMINKARKIFGMHPVDVYKASKNL